jgi:hypothetical protein
MTTDKSGGLSYFCQLSLRRYETAFMMQRKLRRAMVNFDREPRTGEIEVDAWFKHVPRSQPLRTHLKG